MWFNKNDIILKNKIVIEDIHGYVLPHAGTKHTGDIIAHTLRFKPKKKFSKVFILYYPSNEKPNINGKHHHEFFVPWKSLDYVFKESWNIKEKILFIPYNLRSINVNLSYINLEETLLIVSADFSHYIEMDTAIKLENKAAHNLMFNNLNTKYNNVVDDIISFRKLSSITKTNDLQLQWVGRTRSQGLEAVGYLSFLIREIPDAIIDPPDGMFVTVYDKDMNARECLGEWFGDKEWNKSIENELINRVVSKGRSPSRLAPHLDEANNNNVKIELSNYTITYLYQDTKPFIRGWHGIKYNAFYLPDVFLENTYNNGKWIKNEDTTWSSGKRFYLRETFNRLTQKAGKSYSNNYEVYSSKVKHIRL